MAGAYIAQILVTVGLTAWVYQTLKTSFENTINELREKVNSLQKEVISLRESENKWYKKYHKLLLIHKKATCNAKDCPIKNAVEEHLSQEGEV